MNAQHLAALGKMVREAIETHVTAAVEAMSGEFGKQLSERDAHIENLTAQLQQLQNAPTPGYDDSEIKAAVQALRESIPAGYDDSALKSAFSEQGKRVAAVVDGVQAIKDRIEEVAKSVPAAYDDTWARQSFDAVEKQLDKLKAVEAPTPYDDAALRNEVAESLKFQTEAFESLLEQFKNAPKPADGRDALQLEVLPAIDEQKSYTRGTYAKHAGGLWRAFEQTSGMRGWECIVNGVKSVDARWDGKTLIETTTLSDGTTHETRKSFAVQEYKGVFAHGEHEQGDTVTWAGSLWHCNVTGTKALPGDGSEDWTLAVKKGRDGREVVKTERAQGPVKIGHPSGNPLSRRRGFIENGGAE